MSVFVWLDYSERERRKMLDVVDAFREHDTRDELGVGSVRDAFADMLFPGTSTIMTRARYFLLVPWAYQRLERLRVRSAEIAARARQAELNLVEPPSAITKTGPLFVPHDATTPPINGASGASIRQGSVKSWKRFRGSTRDTGVNTPTTLTSLT